MSIPADGAPFLAIGYFGWVLIIGNRGAMVYIKTARNGKETGEWTLDRLRSAVERGDVRQDDFVWKDGWEAWRVLSAAADDLGLELPMQDESKRSKRSKWSSMPVLVVIGMLAVFRFGNFNSPDQGSSPDVGSIDQESSPQPVLDGPFSYEMLWDESISMAWREAGLAKFMVEEIGEFHAKNIVQLPHVGGVHTWTNYTFGSVAGVSVRICQKLPGEVPSCISTLRPGKLRVDGVRDGGVLSFHASYYDIETIGLTGVRYSHPGVAVFAIFEQDKVSALDVVYSGYTSQGKRMDVTKALPGHFDGF